MSIRLKDVTFSYPKNVSPTLDINCLEIATGSMTALVGPNGSGKTTLFKCLEGFVTPQRGKIEIDGPVDSRDYQVAQVFQAEQSFEHITVKEWVELNLMLKGMDPSAQIIERLLTSADLIETENKLVTRLSGGQQRRLSLASSLAGNPNLLLLDEPTTELDQNARSQVWNLILAYCKENAGTVLFSTHLMEEVQQYADKVYLIDSGSIIGTGSPEQLVHALGVTFVITADNDVDKFTRDSDAYFTRVEGDSALIYVTDATKFAELYGTDETLLSEGFHLRPPNMSDLYSLTFSEGSSS